MENHESICPGSYTKKRYPGGMCDNFCKILLISHIRRQSFGATLLNANPLKVVIFYEITILSF